ncbi:MAG: hypothetical protein NVS3B10_06250 [Polyangiales bacterium]
MPWFSAHCVSYVKFDDGEQDTYPVEENVLLIEAADPEAAASAARAIAEENYDGDEVDWDGRPGVYVFAGVRKVVGCEDAASIERPSTAAAAPWRPGHGTELTYAYLELDGEEELAQLLAGEGVVASIDE